MASNSTSSSSGGPEAGPSIDPSTMPHDSLQANVMFAAVITWLISVAFTAVRFYTRCAIVRATTTSDWCILASVVCTETQIYTGAGPGMFLLLLTTMP